MDLGGRLTISPRKRSAPCANHRLSSGVWRSSWVAERPGSGWGAGRASA